MVTKVETSYDMAYGDDHSLSALIMDNQQLLFMKSVFVNNGVKILRIREDQVDRFLVEHPTYKRGFFHRKHREISRWVTNGKNDKFIPESQIDKFLSIHPDWYKGNSKSGGIKNKDTQIFVKNNPSKSDKRRRELSEFMSSDNNPMKSELGRLHN